MTPVPAHDRADGVDRGARWRADHGPATNQSSTSSSSPPRALTRRLSVDPPDLPSSLSSQQSQAADLQVRTRPRRALKPIGAAKNDLSSR